MPGPTLISFLRVQPLVIQKGDDAPQHCDPLSTWGNPSETNIMLGFVREFSSSTSASTNSCTYHQGRILCWSHMWGEILAQDSEDIVTLTREGRSFLTFMLTRCSLRWWFPIHTEVFNIPSSQVEISAPALPPTRNLHALEIWLALLWQQQNYHSERFVMTGKESVGE